MGLPFNETPAPPRVFPSNVMSKDLITYGEGDIDENAYVSGHSQSGNIDTSLTTYESVLKYYKIVCPVTKRVSKAQLRNVLGTTSSQNILGREIIDIDEDVILVESPPPPMKLILGHNLLIIIL